MKEPSEVNPVLASVIQSELKKCSGEIDGKGGKIIKCHDGYDRWSDWTNGTIGTWDRQWGQSAPNGGPREIILAYHFN